MRRVWIGAAILGITLLNFFQFPGHTWLQSDTQIYAPILEHMWNPAVLQKDLVAQHPHVAFTLYDETALALRRATGLDFRYLLEAEQFVVRALGIWGVYLIATALGLSDLVALIVTAIFSLGATILGPSVLIFEYEPVPRGLAVPLMFLATGLIAHERFLGGGIAASVAFLVHAPTVFPFWVVYLAWALWPSKPYTMRRKLIPLWVLATAGLVLLAASLHETSSAETRPFFTRLDPHQEELQRLRAGYNYISLWWSQRIVHYLILYAATVAAAWRLRRDMPRPLRFFCLGLPLMGLASIPVSYVLLEKVHWALIPEAQPLRALLFVTAFAMLLGAAAAARAVAERHYAEALVWLALAFLPPVNREIARPSWNRVGVVILLALLTLAAMWVIQSGARWSKLAAAVAIVVPFFVIPTWGRVENYPRLHNPELAQLAAWGRSSTPQDAVFLFPDADQDLEPGVFRAESLRAVYVDWKTGGQVNFFKDLGEEWWRRWQKTMAQPFDAHDLAPYQGLGIDYIVVGAKNKLAGTPPVFQNALYAVYRL
jgi:hypothetical protein